jgi:hypothetical protein
MEALERALSRRNLSLDDKIFDNVVVRSVNDIKRLIAEFDPNVSQQQSAISISSVIESNEDGRRVMHPVTTETKSRTRREFLVEGLTIARDRLNLADTTAVSAIPVVVNGVQMLPPRFADSVEGHMWVDPLIKRWLGGYREGNMICWDLQDGFTYRYDIFQHKLTRLKK